MLIFWNGGARFFANMWRRPVSAGAYGDEDEENGAVECFKPCPSAAIVRRKSMLKGVAKS